MRNKSDLMDKLRAYETFLNDSLVKAEGNYQKDFSKFTEFSANNPIKERIEDLTKLKLRDGLSEVAMLSLIEYETLKKVQDKLYGSFPELKKSSKPETVNYPKK